MIKLLLDKPIFASLDAGFCHDMCNDGRNMQNFVRDTCNISRHGFVTLVCVYEANGGT